MGRCSGKSKGVKVMAGEIAVDGVRTRARATVAMAAAAASSGGSSLPGKNKIKKVASATTPNIIRELRSRRRVVDNSTPTSFSRKTTSSSSDFDMLAGEEAANANCCSRSDSPAMVAASCCSCDNRLFGSSELVNKDQSEIADPEHEQVESIDISSRFFGRTTTATVIRGDDESKLRRAEESDGLDSPAKLRDDANSTVHIKTPSNSELEEFFSAAEKDLQKRFTKKYNFDIVKDVPLEGRYEWVPIKP